MNYSQDPEIEAASSLVVAALKEFYEQGDKNTKNPYEEIKKKQKGGRKLGGFLCLFKS